MTLNLVLKTEAVCQSIYNQRQLIIQLILKFQKSRFRFAFWMWAHTNVCLYTIYICSYAVNCRTMHKDDDHGCINTTRSLWHRHWPDHWHCLRLMSQFWLLLIQTDNTQQTDLSTELYQMQPQKAIGDKWQWKQLQRCFFFDLDILVVFLLLFIFIFTFTFTFFECARSFWLSIRSIF